MTTAHTPLDGEDAARFIARTAGEGAERPVVTTAAGPVAGIRRVGPGRTTSDAFLGIPYAAAPVGPLRLAAPRPPRPWEEARDGSVYGPTPQRRPFGEVTAIPEPTIPGDDVLSVNVFTPGLSERDRAGAGLPVLVYIHGGGYKAGSPASPWYDGAAFARDGIVTVTLSYRLGFEGFGSVDGAPENRGLRDQIAALHWVRENITAFGGDPAQVTIAGQSAGGGSVLALMVSPLATGLFARAISQSGALRPQPPAVSRERAERLARIAGVPATPEALGALEADRITAAQDRLEAELGSAPPSTHPGDAAPLSAWLRDVLGTNDLAGLAFQPVADGEVLPADWLGALAHGPSARLPLLAGATAHEFTGIGPEIVPLLADADLGDVLAASPLGPLAGDYLAARGGADDPASVLGSVLTDVTFRVPLARIVRAHAGPTWVYDVRFAPAGGIAQHCIEVPFVFDVLGHPDVPALAGPVVPQELADLIHGAWTEFIRTGRAPWAPWDGRRGMVLGGPDASAVSGEEDVLALETRLAQVLAS